MDDSCPASIEEPGLFYYDCELPRGHDGQHVVHWDQTIEPPRPPVPVNPSWAMYLNALYGPPLSEIMGRIGRQE